MGRLGQERHPSRVPKNPWDRPSGSGGHVQDSVPNRRRQLHKGYIALPTRSHMPNPLDENCAEKQRKVQIQHTARAFIAGWRGACRRREKARMSTCCAVGPPRYPPLVEDRRSAVFVLRSDCRLSISRRILPSSTRWPSRTPCRSGANAWGGATRRDRRQSSRLAWPEKTAISQEVREVKSQEKSLVRVLAFSLSCGFLCLVGRNAAQSRLFWRCRVRHTTWWKHTTAAAATVAAVAAAATTMTAMAATGRGERPQYRTRGLPQLWRSVEHSNPLCSPTS